ncbi:MAG TPA: transcriptional repressor LexA [Smithellaceae bacterium]|nr:transcriptional repressor LexA [Geobacteraceae bacterium]HOS41993.1 transcriptional repressor LexA [Spirochaetota bacterium]HPL68027.1 transcriptional repressor LexA [Smithellaceae bacterium]
MVQSGTLTSTQERVYQFIIEWKKNRGFPPTVREIAKGLGFKSLNNIRQHLQLIEKKGFLKISSGKARGIEVTTQSGKVTSDNGIEVPLVGRVAAGTPIVAEENIEGTVTLDRSLFRGDGLFTLKVRGESMQDIGVCDGDIAVVKQQQSAVNGEVVVAVVDGEATLKRFFKKNDKIVLHAENPNFSDIVVTAPQDVYIAGRLVGIIRKYRSG